MAGHQRRGELLEIFHQEHPDIKCILFDQANIIDGLNEQNNFRAIGGDFFIEVPAGKDAYILKYVLHDWEDEQAALILKNCRTAMEKDARLVIVEVVIPDSIEPRPAKMQTSI